VNGTAWFIGPSITAIFAPAGSEGTSLQISSAGVTILWESCCAQLAAAKDASASNRNVLVGFIGSPPRL
jgi:hypothetical protein